MVVGPGSAWSSTGPCSTIKCGFVLAHGMLHAAGLPDHHWFARIQCKVFGNCKIDDRDLYRDVPPGECCYMEDIMCRHLDSLREKDLKAKGFM